MIDRVRELTAAVDSLVQSGQTVMVGGFGRGGVPFSVLEHMADHPDRFRDLHLVKNDANEPGLGIGALLRQGQVRKLTATHIGLNPEYIAQMNAGEVESELVPQGIFAERLRAAGAGIPGFLTDIAMGTNVAKGKATAQLDGKTFLLERALPGDVALVCADVADRQGNCWWRGSNRNMCPMMAMACKRAIVEAKRIVEVGEIEPENVHLPHLWVTAVVQAKPRRHIKGDAL